MFTTLAVTIALAGGAHYDAPANACGQGYFATAKIAGTRAYWNADHDRKLYRSNGTGNLVAVWDGVRISNRTSHTIRVRHAC